MDNSVALAIAKSGESLELKYLQKHQRLKVAFVRNTLLEHDLDKKRSLEKVATDKNVADVLTKPLSRGSTSTSQRSTE